MQVVHIGLHHCYAGDLRWNLTLLELGMMPTSRVQVQVGMMFSEGVMGYDPSQSESGVAIIHNRSNQETTSLTRMSFAVGQHAHHPAGHCR